MQYPTESDYVGFILRSYSGQGGDAEVEKMREIEEQQMQNVLARICPEYESVTIDGRNADRLLGSKYLDRIGNYFVCLRNQSSKPHYFKLDGKAMPLEDIKKICKRCRPPWNNS